MKKYLLFFFLFSFLVASDYYEHTHIPKDLSFLHLNTQQQKKIKNILKKYRKKLKILHYKEEMWEIELKKAFPKSKLNFKKLLSLNISIKTEMAKTEMDFFYQIHKILNKKQRKKFIKYIEEWEIE